MQNETNCNTTFITNFTTHTGLNRIDHNISIKDGQGEEKSFSELCILIFFFYLTYGARSRRINIAKHTPTN